MGKTRYRTRRQDKVMPDNTRQDKKIRLCVFFFLGQDKAREDKKIGQNKTRKKVKKDRTERHKQI